MTVNLRTSLTIFSVGFAAESASGFAALASSTNQLPFRGAFVLIGPAFTALGILFLYIGRHEWNELHRSRVHHANAAFAVSIVTIALAAAPVAYLTATGGPTPPAWLAFEFGVAVALVFAVTFVTYAIVASHLVGRVGQVAMALGLAWALFLSAQIGLVLIPQLRPLVSALLVRSTALNPVLQPISLLDALLAFSYLAFLIAFVDAHYRVVRGLTPEAPSASPS